MPTPGPGIVDPMTGQLIGPPTTGGKGPPSRAPSSPGPEQQAPSGGKGPDTTKPDWPEKTGPFTKQEWQGAGLKTPPRDYEMRGYPGYDVSKPQDRQLILEDIARARAAAAKGITPRDLARAAEVGAENIDVEKLRKLPRKKVEELDFTIRRSPLGQRKYAARQKAIRMGLIKPGTVEAEPEVEGEAPLTEAELARVEQLTPGLEESVTPGAKLTAQERAQVAMYAPPVEVGRVKNIEAVATQTPDGYWIPNSTLRDIKETSPELAEVLTTQGYRAYQQYLTQDRLNFERNLQKSNPDLYRIYQQQGGQAYDAVVDELSKPNPDADRLAEYLSPEAKQVYEDSSARDKFSILQSEGLVPVTMTYTGESKGKPKIAQGTGYEHRLLTAKGTDIALMGAEILVPGVYVARNWDSLSTAEKAFFIALDAVAVAAPVAGAIPRGARMGATYGRLAMAKGIAREIGAELGAVAMAPVTMLIHPLETGKAGIRQVQNLAETIANPRRISDLVISTSHGTVRLKITKDLTPAQAKAIRDELMVRAMRGERPIIEFQGKKIELARSPLMKETKGGLAHGTPMGEKLEGGFKVGEKGLYFSHEPLPRFAESTSRGAGGEKSVIMIISPEMAEKTVSSGKTWQGTAEMERVARFTDFPPPKQKLFTRIGVNRQKVEIWLYEPLKAKQIAKLKALGMVEAVKSPFQLAIKVKGKRGLGLADNEVNELAKILKASGNVDEARSLLRARSVVKAMRVTPPRLETATGRVDRATVERARAQLAKDIPAVDRFSDLQNLERARPIASTMEARAIVSGRQGRSAIGRTDSRLDVPEVPAARITTTPETPRVPPITPTTSEPPRVPPPPETPREPPRVPPPPAKPPVVLRGNARKSRLTPAELRTAVSWPQGVGWWVDWTGEDGQHYQQFVYGQEAPAGFRMVRPGKGEARRGIQRQRGTRRVRFTKNLGIVKVAVTDPDVQPGRIGAIDYDPITDDIMLPRTNRVRITERRPRIP